MKCATCGRVYDPDGRASQHWIARPDGHGLMCPVCQRRQRRVTHELPLIETRETTG